MRALKICALLAISSAIASGQNASQQKAPDSKECSVPTPDGKKSVKEQPCSPAPAVAPSAAEKFPYPGEAPSPSLNRPDGLPTEPARSAAPAKQFPYPGESSSSSSSSSAGSDSNSSASDSSGTAGPTPDDSGRQGSVRRKLPKPERIQSDEDREAEDLSVAKFYRQSGNLQAAYLRAKDAVSVQPADPIAHFALAEIAQHLNKRQEAAAEYDAYLKLEPDGDQVKAARRALAVLK